MRTINGEEFLSPQEASSILDISYKTLQRWCDAGGRWAWTRTHANGNGNGKGNGNGNSNGYAPRTKVWRQVDVDFTFSRAGHRLYRRKSIQQLLDQLLKEEKEPHKTKTQKQRLSHAA